ncbi:hypothetical protein [Actinomycetospora termitidis]|uniref:Uncharacterized protein n=1 Tax=Actinomycetospora termitidis TaxID=3053470 RepID=A0ABT7MCP2_9PSEU|nr:hypothetical protein [Actinomycetospora sp. Odt1-22]MDL5157934.1 hypothetical protein [Actinomycetospora sp. Odt1-22]
MRSLGALLLGDGRFGEPLRRELLEARPVVFEEGLRGTYVPREGREYTRNPTRGAVAVCANRFVVWSRRSKTVDVPLTRPWLDRMTVAERPAGRLVVGMTLPRDGAPTGTLEVRLRTPAAGRVVALLANVR